MPLFHSYVCNLHTSVSFRLINFAFTLEKQFPIRDLFCNNQLFLYPPTPLPGLQPAYPRRIPSRLGHLQSQRPAASGSRRANQAGQVLPVIYRESVQERDDRTDVSRNFEVQLGIGGAATEETGYR